MVTAIRTIRERIHRWYTETGRLDWTKIIDQLADNYNSSKHTATGMAPKDVRMGDIEEETVPRAHKRDLPVGTCVRISVTHKLFTKSDAPKWSTELFVISKIHSGVQPTMYSLKALKDDEDIVGKFYLEELQEAKDLSTVKVDKVLKRQKRRNGIVYLQVSCSDSSVPRWIKENDFIAVNE